MIAAPDKILYIEYCILNFQPKPFKLNAEDILQRFIFQEITVKNETSGQKGPKISGRPLIGTFLFSHITYPDPIYIGGAPGKALFLNCAVKTRCFKIFHLRMHITQFITV